jgi:hypothetical protein
VLWTGGIATVAILASVGLVVAAANAGEKPAPAAGATDAERVSPLVERASGDFYTEAQIPEVWREVTENYPASLPSGVKFPVDPQANNMTPEQAEFTLQCPGVYPAGGSK